MDDLASVFDILKKSLPGYEGRPQQIHMAGEAFACLREKKRLIVEAGTGVGKSFDYLIPAILSKKTTIVSTATKALQDQLANKDLVFLQETLPQRFSFAILKGKNKIIRERIRNHPFKIPNVKHMIIGCIISLSILFILLILPSIIRYIIHCVLPYIQRCINIRGRDE